MKLYRYISELDAHCKNKIRQYERVHGNKISYSFLNPTPLVALVPPQRQLTVGSFWYRLPERVNAKYLCRSNSHTKNLSNKNSGTYTQIGV